MNEATLWGGRFAVGPDPSLDRLNRSLPVDRRLWRHDLRGSRAWARALEGADVLTRGEAEALVEGLDAVEARLAEWDAARWAEAPDEDIHTLVERLLGDEVGALAGKLHTGRSRNDQVATDTRLWAMDAVEELDTAIRGLGGSLLDRAERHVDTVMPAFTHLQPAQPVSAAHWLLSHAWPLQRDRDRLRDTLDRVAVLPLGSGAIAGCPFPVDRAALRDELGFAAVSENSIDAVADRDWAAELLFVMALLGTHLSRLAEDIVLFASPALGFVRLGDAFSTGSSLLPQKRNPDGMELARGKAGSLIGDMTALLTTLKGTPSGYNKDLQEDKTLLFRAFDTLTPVLPAVAGTIRTMEIDVRRCRDGIDSGAMATDLADALVESGMPFRQAHEVVGRAVLAAEEKGVPLEALSDEELRLIAPDLVEVDRAAALDSARSMGRRSVPGGTAPEAVRTQIRTLRDRL
ncbi:MAG: argininosuccinate lyase [Candidatus Longimicrobiales bacterium M2_2A_002]